MANPLYNPGMPLKGKRLRRVAKQIVDLEFRPQQQALKNEAQQIDAQGGALIDRATTYYKDLASQEAGNVALQRAIGDQLQQSLSYNRQQSQEAINQSADRMDAATGDRLQGELAQLRARAAESSGAAADQAARGSGDWQALQALMSQATAARGGEIQHQLQNRLAAQQADVRNRRSALKGQRGAALTKTLIGLRDSEFDKAVTLEGLGLKRQDIALDGARIEQGAADKQADRDQRAADRASREWIATQNINSREKIAELREQDRSQGRKPEPVKSYQIKGQVESARSEVARLLGKGRSQQQVRNRALKAGVPLAIFKAAWELETVGTLTPGTAKGLKNIGVQRIPPEWRRSKVSMQDRPN